MNAIEIRNLSKNYGKKQAVKNLNMTVPEGAIYGFIGENGSGKSTTEKLICGLIQNNGGAVRLFGKDYTDDEVRKNIGVLIEAPGCFPNLSVWDNMMLQAANLSVKNPRQKVSRVLKLVHMEGSASNKFRNCSLGMKQRIGNAFALLGNPKLLVLDEPINGLDADGMRILREVLMERTKSGKCTVLISSHLLGELENVSCRRRVFCHGNWRCQQRRISKIQPIGVVRSTRVGIWPLRARDLHVPDITAYPTGTSLCTYAIEHTLLQVCVGLEWKAFLPELRYDLSAEKPSVRPAGFGIVRQGLSLRQAPSWQFHPAAAGEIADSRAR